MEKPIINEFIECSMPIFLFHQQFIYWAIVLLNGVINPIINGIVNFIFAIAASLVISKLLLSNRVTRCLLGC